MRFGSSDILEDLLFHLLGAPLVIPFGDRLRRNFTGNVDAVPLVALRRLNETVDGGAPSEYSIARDE